MEGNRKIRVYDIMIPGSFCTTVLLYGPPGSGKTTLVADDFPDENTIVVDTTKTFPTTTGKKVVVTTRVENVLASIATGKVTVIDDIFVFRGDEIRQMMRYALESEARLVLVSQIRSFKDERSYPYMSHVVENANIWLKMERYENKGGKLVSLIELVRKRGEWIESGSIRLPVYISNNRIDNQTYEQIEKIRRNG